jgi:thymidylate kinase
MSMTVPMTERDGRKLQTAARIRSLLTALEEDRIRYCHWKSNTAIEQILSGETDLDLLVARACEQRFREILRTLGFVQAVSRISAWHPSIEHHYVYDPDSGRILHVHLHLRLILGHDLLKDYHLPLEEDYLRSTHLWHGLRVPQAEFELIVFIIRMVLKRRLLPVLIASPGKACRAILSRRLPPLSAADALDLQRLEAACEWQGVARLLDRHFPGLSLDEFRSLVIGFKGDSLRDSWGPAWRQLCRVVRPYRMRGPVRTVVLAIYRRLFMAFCMTVARLHLGHPLKKRLRRGCILAVVGGDGAGKTTNIAAMKSWLQQSVAVASLHVGRPRKGALWYLAMVPLRSLRMLRILPERFYSSVSYLLIARCRRRVCRKAQRLRRRRMMVLLDRIPLPGIRSMDCPRIRPLAGAKGIYGLMAGLEEQYYRQTKCADMVIVLRLDPRIARQRRPDDDGPVLKARSGEIWDASWTSGRIRVVDASKPMRDVQQRMREVAWECAARSPLVGELIGVAGSGKSTVAALLATRTFDVSSQLSWKQNIPLCLKVLAHRLPEIIYQAGKGVPLRFLAIMVNIECTLRLLERHRESHGLSCGQVVLDLGPFLQLATLRHAYLPDAPALASSFWLSELTARSRRVVDKVFWLDADHRTLMNRIRGREQSHAMKDRSEGAFERFCAEYRREFADLLAGYPAGQIERIDTGALSARDVSEWIDARL